MSLAAMYQRRRLMPNMMTSTPSVDWNSEGSIAAGQGATAGQATNYGSQATSDYWNRISNFDPTEAVNKYATGTWNQMKSQFDQTLGKLKGSAVGSGRLDTGFYDADVGDLYRSTVSDFGNELARTSLDATRMQMANNESIGNFANTQTERGLDLGVARREELINNQREKAERRRQKRRGIAGFIGGAIGGVGGFLAGGPMGAAAGYQIGKGLGGAV